MRCVLRAAYGAIASREWVKQCEVLLKYTGTRMESMSDPKNQGRGWETLKIKKIEIIALIVFILSTFERLCDALFTVNVTRTESQPCVLKTEKSRPVWLKHKYRPDTPPPPGRGIASLVNAQDGVGSKEFP